MLTRQIRVATHGRYLFEPASSAGPASLLVGFHGYMESAEDQMARLRSIPGVGSWRLASIQALNRFYRGRRSQDVVASWMTRQDRELAIADNQAYVAAVITEIGQQSGTAPGVVFAGFSQGVAMAFRAACASAAPVLGVMALGSDVPPELEAPVLGRIPAVLLGRGLSDDLYPLAQWEADRARLLDAGVDTDGFAFDAGHEWNDTFSRRAGELLTRVRA
jgi:predicted esterase